MNFRNYQKIIRFTGILAILILYIGIIYGLFSINLHLFSSRPISYLGVDHRTMYLFRTTLILAAIFMIIFGLQVKKVFQSSSSFILILIFGQICQIITALLLDNGSTKSLHSLTAFALAFSLPLLMWRFTVSQSNKQIHKLSLNLVIAETISLTIGLSLFIFVKGYAPFGEILTVLFFHLWVILITLNWPKTNTKTS